MLSGAVSAGCVSPSASEGPVPASLVADDVSLRGLSGVRYEGCTLHEFETEMPAKAVNARLPPGYVAHSGYRHDLPTAGVFLKVLDCDAWSTDRAGDDGARLAYVGAFVSPDQEIAGKRYSVFLFEMYLSHPHSAVGHALRAGLLAPTAAFIDVESSASGPLRRNMVHVTVDDATVYSFVEGAKKLLSSEPACPTRAPGRFHALSSTSDVVWLDDRPMEALDDCPVMAPAALQARSGVLAELSPGGAGGIPGIGRESGVEGLYSFGGA